MCGESPSVRPSNGYSYSRGSEAPDFRRANDGGLCIDYGSRGARDPRASVRRAYDLSAHARDVRRGDIIVFLKPGEPDLFLVKRTIGVPGDHLHLRNGIVDPAKLLAELNASPAVSNAAYDGETVSATVLATTSALRYVYEEIIIAGLMPVDMPTVAGLQEFVL